MKIFRSLRLPVLAFLGLSFIAAPALALTVRESQWHLDALKISEAHKISKGEGVVVAVIDEGVDASHPDLAGQVLAGTGFGPYAGTDGRTDHSAIGHGTAMSGTIAAKGGGANNALGIAPGAKILPIAINFEGSTNFPQIADAIRWAVDHGAKVVSMSFGSAGTFDQQRPELIKAVRYALEHDVVLVAATGNTTTTDGKVLPENDVTIPADISGVVAVAAGDRTASHNPTSVYGPEVVLTAPGLKMGTILPYRVSKSGYGLTGETSNAAAVVAGATALIRAEFPTMDAKNVINRLIKTAKDQGNPGRDIYFGYGTVRPLVALTADIPTVTEWPLPLPALPEEPKAATAKKKQDPAAIGWGIAISLAVIFFVIRAIIRFIRARRQPSLLETPAVPYVPPRQDPPPGDSQPPNPL